MRGAAVTLPTPYTRTVLTTVLSLLLAAIANAGFFLPKLPETGEQVTALPYPDKVVHVLIFAFTTWAIVRLVAPRRARMARKPDPTAVRGRVMACVIALIAWAWVIEGIQSFMPNRSADPTDVAADAIGIALGVWAALALARRRR